MKVKLLADYRGVLTDERFYEAGVRDIPEPHAVALLSAGRAAEVKKEPQKQSYDLWDTKDLRQLAKKRGIKGYSRMKRSTLLDRLGE